MRGERVGFPCSDALDAWELLAVRARHCWSALCSGRVALKGGGGVMVARAVQRLLWLLVGLDGVMLELDKTSQLQALVRLAQVRDGPQLVFFRAMRRVVRSRCENAATELSS